MLILAAVAGFLYAVVNAVGAWMVARRKPWVAALFMLAAAVLVVASAALLFDFAYARVLLASGLSLASVASFINAHIVLGNVVWRFHLLRAGVGVAIYLLGSYGLG